MLHFQRWKVILVGIIVLLGFVFAAPNLFPSSALQGLPSWFPHKQVYVHAGVQDANGAAASYTVGHTSAAGSAMV